jgi:hypothetical protein
MGAHVPPIPTASSEDRLGWKAEDSDAESVVCGHLLISRSGWNINVGATKQSL